jgi:hypothetical protein
VAPIANELISEQLKPGRLTLRGSAAWEQTQLTPGVSTQAAPFQFGFVTCTGDRIQMTTSHTVLLLGVVTGWGGLLASLVLLFRNPLFAVLGILAAMALLLAAIASFVKKTEAKKVR